MHRASLCLILFALMACSEPAEDTGPPEPIVDLEPRRDAGTPDAPDPMPEPDTPEPDPGPAPEPDASPDPDPQPDVEPGLYDSVEGLTGEQLRNGLRAIVDDHRIFTYAQSRDFMYGIRASIDVRDGRIECIYTGRTTAPDSTRTPGNFNTEHSWPRSDGADMTPALSDLHHLFPATADANQARGSIAFGDTDCNGNSCDFSDGGSALGQRSGGGGDVFEVRPERRGDIARAHFYFAIRYNQRIDSNEEATLRQWHQQDPPDELERARNDGIERFQRNRNPFVDRPDFVDSLTDF